MSTPPPSKTPSPTSTDELLNEALEETFPASDPVQPVQPEQRDKLPPAHKPGSDVHNE